jgi:hypothetical protein
MLVVDGFQQKEVDHSSREHQSMQVDSMWKKKGRVQVII